MHNRLKNRLRAEASHLLHQQQEKRQKAWRSKNLSGFMLCRQASGDWPGGRLRMREEYLHAPPHQCVWWCCRATQRREPGLEHAHQ
uniref:Pco092382 n=1 Tax=Arundo donax TaxID=35708 RepID=A0A0A9EXV0_ARUDO